MTGIFNALAVHAPAAMETLGKLIAHPNTPASVQADLGKFIFEHFHGKAAARVNVEGRMDVHQIIASAIVLDGLPQDPPLRILEGEYTDEEREADRETDLDD